MTRGLAAGRAPWGNMYEFALVSTWPPAVALPGFLLRAHRSATFGVWIVAHRPARPRPGGHRALHPGRRPGAGAGLVLAGHPRRRRDHSPAASSPSAPSRPRCSWCATAERPAASEPSPGGYAAELPVGATLGRVAHAAHLFAFPIWTFAVIAGAIWAENSWGRYWGWDPKETWAFITWVLLRRLPARPGDRRLARPRAAWFALAGYAAFLFNFFGVNMWITGLHSYAGV